MSYIIHKSLVKETASNKPNAATAFNLPDSATAPFRSFDSVLATNDLVYYHADNGTDWEEGIGTFTAGTPDTLTRSSVLDSSNSGSAVDFSGGADVKIGITLPANIGEQLDLATRGITPGGRLSIVSGTPLYDWARIVATPNAISGQDTTNDTVTITGHPFLLGHKVQSTATSGGLTINTDYWVGNVSTNTLSLFTSYDDAVAGTPKVDITGAVTASISFRGRNSSTIYYMPFNHNLIALWDGYRWKIVEFSETSLALGTMTASKPYDIFAYLSSGTLALEKLVWTDDTTRATAITLQDGKLCKSGDKTRLYLGTLYSTGATNVELSTNKCHLVNYYNTLPFETRISESAASWTYSSTTVRQVNANSANQVDIVLPYDNWPVNTYISSAVNNSTSTGRLVSYGIGLDSTTAFYTSFNSIVNNITSTSARTKAQANSNFIPGRHYLAMLEKGNGTDTQTWIGSNFYTFMYISIPA